jgi:hypothetical protein
MSTQTVVNETTARSGDGRIVRVIGPVVDVEFPPATCPTSTPR